MAERDHEWPPLAAFEARLRRRAHIGLPEARALRPDDPLPLVAGPGDVIILRHAPVTRLRSRDPLHETAFLEVAAPLEEQVPGLLAIACAAYRAGGERLLFQSTRAVGTLSLITREQSGFTIEASLRFVNPELDEEHLGARVLAGRLLVEE